MTSLAIEVPISCITTSAAPVIGGYTTADIIEKNGNVVTGLKQVSRLGMPLVNELVIGLPYGTLAMQHTAAT